MDSVENDHNVYILGAGFSAGAGLPVIKNFLLRLRDSHPLAGTTGQARRSQGGPARFGISTKSNVRRVLGDIVGDNFPAA